jgi:2',3'-cyclic-nucleotide 2'-phosphodiesterase
MKILFIGDIVGRSGRDAVTKHLPMLREKLQLDFVIANGENAAGGFGINEKCSKEIFSAGVDVITGGNHSWDKMDVIPYIEREKRLIRPLNFPKKTPGKGIFETTLHGKYKCVVINLLGRLFMDAVDDPFAAVDLALQQHTLGQNCHIIFVDMHTEASSEKAAMGNYLDGRVSAVIGTHTHVPSADYRLLTKGTAFQDDAGMCGDYNSVIGMALPTPIERFTRKMRIGPLKAASGEATLCGTFLNIDETTGKTTDIQPVRLGGLLAPNMPNL